MTGCPCGYEPPRGKYNGKRTLYAHRRQCPTFWQSVYDEMKRIAMVLYDAEIAISWEEWNRYRGEGFPTADTMKAWGHPWEVLQLQSGLGVSSRGRGSLRSKGKIADDAAIWHVMNKLAIVESLVDTPSETYQAFAGDGLPICEETYRRTGRMILR